MKTLRECGEGSVRSAHLLSDPFPTEVFSDLKDGVEIVLALAAKKASEIG